jgi:hypothetical protein
MVWWMIAAECSGAMAAAAAAMVVGHDESLTSRPRGHLEHSKLLLKRLLTPLLYVYYY